MKRERIEVSGDAAKELAREWGAEDWEQVDRVKQAGHIACRWVYQADGAGRCLVCREVAMPDGFWDEDE